MISGAKIVRKELSDLDFTEREIHEIAHLVEVHDLIEREKTPNEQMIFEADCLGMIDRERTGRGSLSLDGVAKFMTHFETRRMQRLKSKLARTQAKSLFEKAKKIISKYKSDRRT